MKNVVAFALILFGSIVADANIYLSMLCIVTGMGVFCFANQKTSHSS